MSIFRRVVNTFSRSKLHQEIDAEIQSHVEMRIADNIAAGMSPEEAHRDALIRFGSRVAMRERIAAADAATAFDAFGRDLRYAARQLRRSPAFTATALVTLILGIGANVVVFAVLNAMVLRPLDVPEPIGLYNVVHKSPGNDNQSYPDYVDFKTKNSTFSDMAAYRIENAGLSTRDTAYKCWYYRVSGNYFDLLGAQPAQGRFFHASDEHGPNSAPYIVLSYNFWRRYFGAEARIVGTTIDVNKHPFTVIGVAPAAFHGSELFLWPDFWMPVVDNPDDEGTDFLSWRGSQNLWILGKLKPGVTPQQATDNLNAIAHELARQNPEDDGLDARLVKPGLLADMFGGPARSFLAGIMILAFLVLLAACANLASLFAARTADRSRELAIRLALGSSRWNVLRQLLAEAVLLSVLGGALGTLFSTVLLNALTRWQPFPQFPIHVTVSPDPAVYLVALILSIGSGVLCGLIPARQIWATDSTQVMKTGGATLVFRRFTLRDLLLGIQITLCTLLVTSSFVALRGMQRSLHAPLGFQPKNVLLAETDLHMGGHFGGSVTQIRKRMLEEVGGIAGVTAVGIIDDPPLGTGGSSSYVYREGTTDFRPSNRALGAKFFGISPDYLQAAGTRLLSGRDFTWHDDAKAPKVAIVNELFARSMFGNADAVGRRFMWGDKLSYEIVGVVENGKYDSLTERPWAAMFLPLEQNRNSDTSLVVRSPLPPSEIVPEVRRTLAQIDPSLPFMFHTWPDALEFVLFPARVATASLGVMGLLAAMLAVTGVFGMAMYSVSKRVREFGIRVAVGAQPVQLMRSALSRPLILLLSGSAAGLLLGVIASQLLAQIVYQATPRDPLVFAGVVITMALLGLVATWIPAERALHVHPARLLREE
jgi:predicted permease